MIVVKQVDFLNKFEADAVLCLLNEYAEHEMGGAEGLSEYTKLNLIRELRKREGCAVFLAYARDFAVGLLISFEAFSTFQCKPILNIHDVVVSEEYRGQGVCRLMFSEVEAHAKRRGCCKVTLEVLEGNLVAKKAYENMGYHGYELDPKFGAALFFEKKIG